jgi:ATP-binding cassette subfamily C (CFTR/MRP) protein 1
VDLLPSADHIVALGIDGRIREQGTFEELNVAEGYVHGFSIEASREKTAPADVGDQENDTEEHPILQRQKSIVTDIPDDGSRQRGDSSTYSYYFRAIGWRYTLIFALLLLIENIFKTFAVRLLRLFIQRH